MMRMLRNTNYQAISNLQISFLPDNAAADMKQERAKVLVAIVRNNNIKFAMHKLTSINVLVRGKFRK